MSIEIVTFGCRLNSYESELIRKFASNARLTSVIIINSCAVTGEAERQLRQTIRCIKKEKPEARIVVTGCAAQINPEVYANMPEVSVVIGNIEKLEQETYNKLLELRNVANTGTYDENKIKSEITPQSVPIARCAVMVSDIMSVKNTALHMVDGFEGKVRGFIQVQNGCNHRCTFCIVPYSRGNSRSVPFGEIVEQTRLLVEKGYKELVLTGVDIAEYGMDLPGKPSLGQVVKRLLKLAPDLPRIRLSSIDVAEIDNHLLDLIANEPRFMPHLHLSLQSGDDLILKRMKRRHSCTQALEFCYKVRQLRPNIALGADIIAGFPTETDDMFLNTYNLINEGGIVYLHVFPYSERANTLAAKMQQVPKVIRKHRAAILRELGAKMLNLHQSKQIGKVLKVLIENEWVGRAEDYSTVKFGECIDSQKSNIGRLIDCFIMGTASAKDGGYLIGNGFK
ncbi:Threonylcarbamoyladenosine tRNA methylthiotransferase MtaB [Alphaproteobacteria bacterium]